MFKFINKESKTIVGAATIVGILSFVSRIVGLIRDRILAGKFGAGDVLDVYYAAFKVPDFLFSLIVVGALSASFIPLFTKQYKKFDKKQAWRFTNNVVSMLGVVMICFSVTLFIFIDPISSIIAPGFSEAKQLMVESMIKVMLIAQFILAISMVLGSVLQSLKRFFLYALAPILYNVGIILGAIFFVDKIGLIGLAWGVVLGAVLHLIVQVIGVFLSGYRYRWSFQLSDKSIATMLRMTGPRVLGIAVNQILFIILTMVATTMTIGSVTVFQFAYNIQFFPIGIIGISYAIAAFPAFSDHIAKKEIDKFKITFLSTVRQVLFFMIPITLLFLIFRAQIVRVVVGAGAFDWEATILTADTLAFFALTFIPQSLVYILARAFFALENTVTPLVAGFVASLVGIISAFLFKESFGVIGLSMAYSLAMIVNMILLWAPLRQKMGSLGESVISQSLLKMSAAGLVCGVMMQTLKPVAVELIPNDTFIGVLSQGVLAGGVGLVLYILVSYLLKSEELDVFIAAMHKKILKKTVPEESFSNTDNIGGS